jgi:hypothetical protein
MVCLEKFRWFHILMNLQYIIIKKLLSKSIVRTSHLFGQDLFSIDLFKKRGLHIGLLNSSNTFY